MNSTDMNALMEYQENLPSLNSTLDLDHELQEVRQEISNIVGSSGLDDVEFSFDLSKQENIQHEQV